MVDTLKECAPWSTYILHVDGKAAVVSVSNATDFGAKIYDKALAGGLLRRLKLKPALIRK